jgi:hypothetical protein
MIKSHPSPYIGYLPSRTPQKWPNYPLKSKKELKLSARNLADASSLMLRPLKSIKIFLNFSETQPRRKRLSNTSRG